MKKFIFFLLFLSATMLHAQYSVRIVVNTIATKPNDDIYVAGNFNNWNPKDENYKLKPFGGSRKGVVLKDLAPGNYAFKFFRGNTDKMECTADGREIADRVIEVNADAVQQCDIAGWKDDYPVHPKKYTASPNVRVIDTAFKIPQLNRTRKIWIYLPKGYVTSSKTYPVLYMQDGQNIFNEFTASAGEWGVDECLDTLQQKTGKECIVIGIDNGGDKRSAEYNPYEEGKAYLDFLTTTLKPFIDSKYRTKKGSDYTFIAGSNLGGLISLYAVIKYPQVFGTAGVFSPMLSSGNQIFTDIKDYEPKIVSRFYLYAGGKDGMSVTNDVKQLTTILQTKTNYHVRQTINPLGQPNEKYWREEFAVFYMWMMQ
jgi:metallo-beta-lactamase class B